MHRSTILLVGCLGFVVGIGIGQVLEPVGIEIFGGGFFVATLLVAVAGRKALWLAVVIVGTVCGVWRAQAYAPIPVPPPLGWQEFTATVARQPELRQDQQRLVVRTAIEGAFAQVSVPLQPRYQLGDQLQLACELEAPEPFDDFRYDKYLERYGIGAVCRFPRVELLGSTSSLNRQAFAVAWRLKLGLQRALAPPEQGVIVGALFGDKRAVPQDIMDQFQVTGTTHLLVISGSHVVLFTVLLTAVLQLLNLPRRTLLACVMVALLLYVFITGWQASAIRSVIFAGAAILGELLGRPSLSLRVLVLSGAAMLAANPMLLLWDAGFQLSFLATFGIIVFTPWFQERSLFLPTLLGLRTAFATSVAAILATAPLIAFQFHQFSLVAFAANVVLVPMMPLEMVAGIVVMLAAQLSPPLAELLGLPAYFLIHLMVQLVAWFAALPYASLTVPDFPLWLFVVLQGAVGVFAARILLTDAPTSR